MVVIRGALNLIKTNQLSSSDVTKWLIDINEKHLECSSELLRFISEMPKDFDPIFDLTDIYQILKYLKIKFLYFHH